MIKPIGGRGKKAPYETVQMRVPAPIKTQIEGLIQQYRDQVLGEPESVDIEEEKPVFRFTQAELEAFVRQVLSDSVVTRNGRDRGSVKRALEAIVKQISHA